MQNEQPIQAGTNNYFPVVGIGASAGGLKALIQFFELMPASSGMAFVVILHLSPDHESHSADLLQNVTAMPVTQVNEPVQVEPDHVYVIPPTKHLHINDGFILVKELPPERAQHVAIDLFFRTLADAHRDRAICVVLSGSGSDGTVGLTRVKEQGGVALAQSPDDAEYDGMPRNAIATGVVDFVLPVAEIPGKLVQLWQNASVIRLPAAEEPIRIVDPSQAAEEALRNILLTLRARTGHDFSHYKRATVLRRIERRLQVNQTPDLPAYLNFLRAHQDETPALLRDMLISVTNFFRDHEAFEALEREVIPRLFAGKTPADQVRVWVAGCATGEEAYSIAMLLSEHAAGLAHPPAIQVFATDIDEPMIARAREGIYSESISTDISPARLRNFFIKEAGGYSVKKSVREKSLFAAHNLLKDPPFSRLDMVSCRNLMIYLNRDVQEQILRLFHFAMRPGGYLFLGSSESAESVPNLFIALDKKHRLFKANPVSRTAFSVPTLPLGAPAPKPTVAITAASEPKRISFGELHQQLLEQYAPPSVIIDHDYDIVHLSDRAGRFLQFAGGEPSHNLLKVIHPELRLDLRTALFQAIQSGRSVEARRVRLNREGHTYYVNMIARPVQSDEVGGSFVLVIFDEVEEVLGPDSKEQGHDAPEPIIQQLEAELRRTKEQLQATIEQYETAHEELKASNEELQAINEELRSTTEELETSREELQSINEELMTVNYELKNKVEEVGAVNDDLKNLIASTEIATIFVDRALKIKRFTPRALELFNLIPTDTGRSLLDITHRLAYAHLADDAAQVFDTLRTIERELAGPDGRWYITRIFPYRTRDDRIEGAVLTFVDITARKRAEAAKFFLAAIVESSQDSILTTNFDGIITSWNRAAEELYGYPAREAIGKPLTMLTLPEDLQEVLRHTEQIKHSQKVEIYNTVRVHKAGRQMNLEIVMSPVKDTQGQVIGVSTIARDATGRRQVEEQLRLNEERLRLMMESVTDYAIIFTDAEGHIERWNVGAERIFGWTAAEAIGQRCNMIFTPEDRAAGAPEAERQQALAHGCAADERWHVRKDGSRLYVSGVMSALRDEGLSGFVKIARDLTERQQTEEQLSQAREELESTVQARTQELRAAYDSLLHEVDERRDAEERIKELLRTIITTQEDERTRISRELHDHLGQLLTALQLNLETLKKHPSKDQKELRATIEQAQDVAKQLDEGVDFLAWELRPAPLDDLGLAAALENFVAEWTKHYGTTGRFHKGGVALLHLAPVVEINLYRIAQEALNNVTKHAQADHVDVILERRDNHVVLIIEDDGIGFEPNLEATPSGRGLGLIGMRERAALVGGTLEIESTPGNGTTVYIRIPLSDFSQHKGTRD